MFSFVECMEGGERLKDHLPCALYRHRAVCKSCCFESHREGIFFFNAENYEAPDISYGSVQLALSFCL